MRNLRKKRGINIKTKFNLLTHFDRKWPEKLIPGFLQTCYRDYIICSLLYKVSYLGLNSLFGRVTTNLLKQSPCIEKLSLYDEDATPLSEDEEHVFIGREQLPDAIKNVDIVVIGDEACGIHGEERLKMMGPKIIRYTEAILASSPNAIIVIAASPLNILVPLVGHFLGPDWQHRLLGITSVDTLRASRILNGLLKNPLEKAHILPVVGGSSPTSRVPLFSHLHPKTAICKDIRDQILEKMKMFDNSKFQETESVERAYSAVRFIHSVIAGMLKDSPIPEIAMTKTTGIPNAEFISLPMLIGKNGIEYAMQLPKFDESEEIMFLEATERLAEDSRKACNFINSLAQESVRNSTLAGSISVNNNLKWNENSDFQNKNENEGLFVKDVQEILRRPASAQYKSQKFNKLISNVKKSQPINDAAMGESSSLKFRIWAKPTENKEELQVKTFSRKSIPLCPNYQLVPATKEFRKSVGRDETKKCVEATEKIADDTPSNLGGVCTSQTQTIVESYDSIEDFKLQNFPQPEHVIQQLVPENTVPEVVSNDPHSQGESSFKHLPSRTDSDMSADESMGSDCTQTLLEETNCHLEALEKCSDTMSQAEARKSYNSRKESKQQLNDDKYEPPHEYESDTNQVTSNQTLRSISQSNGTPPIGIPLKSNKTFVSISQSEVEATSNSSKSHKESEKDLLNNDYGNKYLERNSIIHTKKNDRAGNTVNGKTENNFIAIPNTSVDNVKTQDVDGNKSTLPKFGNNFDKSKVQNSLHDEFKQNDVLVSSQISEGDYGKMRMKKTLLLENLVASSKDVAVFNPSQKGISRENSREKTQSHQPMSNGESLNQYPKGRYFRGVPSVLKLPNKSPADRNVVSEERILCFSNSQTGNILNKQAMPDSVGDGQQTKMGRALLPDTPQSIRPKIPSDKGFGKSEMLLRLKSTAIESKNGKKFPTRPSFNSKIVTDSFREARPKELDNALKSEIQTVKPKIPSEEDVVKPGMMLRLKSKAISSDSSNGKPYAIGPRSNGTTLTDGRCFINRDDFAASKLLATKSSETDSCYLIEDMKKGLLASEQSHIQASGSCPSETPLKLLNHPGGKHRYDKNLKTLELEERNKDVIKDADCFTETTKTELTAVSTESYYKRQKRGLTLSNNRSLNCGSSKTNHSKKRRQHKEAQTQKRGTNRVTAQLSTEGKKADGKKCNVKPSTVDTNKTRAPKKLNRHTEFKNSVSNKKQSESGRLCKKSSSLAREDEWESKYFTKTSEAFFRMFRDTVSNDKIALERGSVKPINFINESTDVNKKAQEMKPSTPGVLAVQSGLVNTKDVQIFKNKLKMNKNLPTKKPFEVCNIKDSIKLDGTVGKSDNNVLSPNCNVVPNLKTQKLNTENDEIKTNLQNNYGTKSIKNNEGPSHNKLNMLQSLESKTENEMPTDEKKVTENSVFNTRITGMKKYQIEKNENLKKENNFSLPTDVDKLFEESSTIPLHSSGKMWTSTGTVTEKGAQHGFANQQCFLHGVNATSDKGRGDAVNRIDFSISNNGLRNEVGPTRVNTCQPSSAPRSMEKIVTDWTAPIVCVPISSKTIKQVNSNSYKEQILNTNMRNTVDEVPRTEKTNKWDRIVNIFKHIITSDMEDRKPDFAKTIKAAKTLRRPPIQERETASKMLHTPLKLTVGGNPFHNQKVMKGKRSSTVKKKTETMKKKSPTETVRRNRIIKKNPKKIVNYFSKRGSTDEKPATKFILNSLERSPGFYNEHAVNIGNNNT